MTVAGRSGSRAPAASLVELGPPAGAPSQLAGKGPNLAHGDYRDEWPFRTCGEFEFLVDSLARLIPLHELDQDACVKQHQCVRWNHDSRSNASCISSSNVSGAASSSDGISSSNTVDPAFSSTV